MPDPNQPDETESSQSIRERAEQLLGATPDDIADMAPEDVQRVVHELQVHQIELELQNDELRRTQVELVEAQDRYTNLYKYSPVGYFVCGGDGMIREANMTAATILAKDRTSLIGRQLSDFVAFDSQDTLYLSWAEALASESRTLCELKMTRPDAAALDARLDIVALDIESADEVRVTLSDISERKQAEAQLTFLATAVSNLGEGVLITGDDVDWPEPKIVFANEAMTRITGYRADELIGQTPRILEGEGTDRKTLDRVNQVLHAGSPATFEIVNYRKDGTRYDSEVFITPLYDAEDRRTNFVSIYRDITILKQTEQARRDGEERTRAILNAAVDAIITIDRKGIIAGVNPATERIFGYSTQQLLGQNVSVLMPSPFREEHDGYLARYHETGEARIIGIGREVIGRRLDGSTFPADLAVSEVDHLGFYTGIIRDITVRATAREAFRREHEFSESLIETVQSIILVLDAQGRIIRFNRAFEQLSGRTLNEVKGLDFVDTFLPERDRERTRNRFQGAIDGDPTRGNISSIVTKEGEELQIEWFDAPLSDVDGNLTAGLLCAGTDVTERLRLEQEVYKAAEDEKHRIALDLHDGLGSMLAGTGMLVAAVKRKTGSGNSVDPTDFDQIADQLREAITHARLLSHGLHPVVDEPGALFGSLAMLAERTQSTSELQCRFVAPHGAFEVSDTNFANHLYRIAQEAARNAVNHSGGTKVVISLDKRDGFFILTISDDGAGFDPQQLLGRRDSGIGLHTMEYRARAIGGSLTIESGSGSGTKVICEAPIE
ncbi:MAG: PAS domain S-box-containing protein [Verrucomicrobiales bacterium]|jgi:PAS domain S-box-containing protein